MKTGFTLLELLIVISIIAILAATIIPNIVGFDTDARLVATKTNLNNIRARITLFRTKEGKYPETMEDLQNTTYNDMGVDQAYLENFPPEFISAKEGNTDIQTITSNESLTGNGGWVYIKDKAKVVVNWDEELDNRWGKAQGQIPSKW